MRAFVLLVLILLFVVTAKAVDEEECRNEWCTKDSIRVTYIGGKKLCCKNKKHSYMFTRTTFYDDRKVTVQCFCRIAD
ncbi:hypothetical protein RRG08_029996 [Elysia crispata]|uniref:Uncharacterized protein n=1 Tax=Elysia crispata TaxID=231223 RepID=A0AAE0ZJ97_9GAST|nr:hypothetical protein RRG08_029996 [Elysia crispata]